MNQPHIRREFFGPRDNFPLSAADFANACRWCDTMIELRAGRDDYLHQHGLDRRIQLPAHMWGQDFVSANFAKIARKDYHTLNHLRCLTYNFTGFSLLTMAPCENTPEVSQVPADADAIIRSNARRAADAAVDFVRSTRHTPRNYVVDVPRMFGESGWEIDGTIVNFDTWSTQQRIHGLLGSGILERLARRIMHNGRARIVEIGAGYGNLAYTLFRMLGPIDYYIVDLPESMIYSSIYLDTVLPQQPVRLAVPGKALAPQASGISLVGNHTLGEFLPQIGEVDLVLNVMSLSEMSPAQVGNYGRAVRHLLGREGVFYEQNYLLPGLHTDIVSILGRELPYGVQLAETESPHRGRGTARVWANQYQDELWNRRPVDRLVGAAGLVSGQVAIPRYAESPSLMPVG